MTIGPPTGMRDWLPQDALLRQRLMESIGAVYRLYGYLPIDTPVMEDLAVLLGKGGGENEKLLFKILKRGDKLTESKEAHGDLADYGLRFDLTVPLARFVATHQGKIPKVFRRYHIGPVWRADRPQKGRFREFYQCDIDVVGGASSAYEVEIITATERVLKELNLGKYRFHLSDKRLLPLLLRGFGVPDERINPVTICLDKLDKTPNWLQILDEVLNIVSASRAVAKTVENFLMDAVEARKKEKGMRANVEQFQHLWEKIPDREVRDKLDGVRDNLTAIIAAVRAINDNSAITFDPILVRGMDYYTGPIYEAVVEGYPSAVLGGGRYDDLIGQLAGKKIPAVGCSIGFERILAILQEHEAGRAVTALPQVLLVNDGQSMELLHQQAEQLRDVGLCIETYLDHNDVGKQLKYAEAAGIIWAIKRFDAASALVTVRYLPERRDLTMPLSELQARLSGKRSA